MTENGKAVAASALPASRCSDDELDDPDLQRLLVQVSAATAAQNKDRLASGTLIKLQKIIHRYKTHVDSDFDDSTGDAIALNLLAYVATLSTSNSTKRSILESMKWILKLKNKVMNPKVSAALDAQVACSSADMRKDHQAGRGGSSACVAMSHIDILHCTNTCLQNGGGILTDHEVMVIRQCALGAATGRRKSEIMTIAGASFRLERVAMKDKDGKVMHNEDGTVIWIRVLHFQNCFMKNNGVGIFHNSSMETRETHGNPIVWTLLLLQRRGMITSAHDVYTGKETINIDESVCEGATVLESKLHQAVAGQKGKLKTEWRTKVTTRLRKNSWHSSRKMLTHRLTVMNFVSRFILCVTTTRITQPVSDMILKLAPFVNSCVMLDTILRENGVLDRQTFESFFAKIRAMLSHQPLMPTRI